MSNSTVEIGAIIERQVKFFHEEVEHTGDPALYAYHLGVLAGLASGVVPAEESLDLLSITDTGGDAISASVAALLLKVQDYAVNNYEDIK